MFPDLPDPPERAGDLDPPPATPGAAPGRQAAQPRTTVVTGPAEVQARIELHLSQGRRRRGVLSLLCISADTIVPATGALSPHLEHRVREEVSHRIGNAVRGSDVILRESERDACVVLPGADALTAERVARRLARLLNGDYRVAGELMRVGVCIGTASQPVDGEKAQDLLRRALERR